MNNNTKNNTTEDIIKSQSWIKAREIRDKLLEHYNNVIKPTLLEFYNITQEDFKISIPETQEIENKPYIKFNGIVISYYSFDTYSNTTYSIQVNQYINTLTSLTIGPSNQPSIKMVKILHDNWDTILNYMDQRIALFCSSTLTNIMNKD
jgi:hypothetical protein